MPDQTRPEVHKKKEDIVESKSGQPQPIDMTPLVTSILSRITIRDNGPAQQIGFTLPPKGNEPEKFVTLDELTKEYKTYEDLVLMHEISIDEEFSLTKVKQNDQLYQTISRTMHNAYWDLMREDLSKDPPNKERAIKLLMDIKMAFRALFTGNNENSLQRVQQYLDEEKVRRCLDLDDNAVEAYTNFVIDLMGKACCPFRDAAINALRQKTDLVDRLRGIMEVLEDMQLDMANFILRITRDKVMILSIEFEKQMFAKARVETGDNYPATQAWLKRAFDHSASFSEAQATRNTAEGSDATAASSSKSYNLHNILKYAYIELLNPKINEPFPELVRLDKERLMQMKNQVLRLIICSAVTSIACRWGLPSDAEPRAKIADSVMILSNDCTSFEKLNDVLECMWIQVSKIIADYLTAAAKPPPETQQETSLKVEIMKLGDENSIVYSVIENKLFLYLEELALGTNDEIVIPVALKDYSVQIVKLGATFKKIVQHNRNVYGEYYEQLVENF